MMHNSELVWKNGVVSMMVSMKKRFGIILMSSPSYVVSMKKGGGGYEKTGFSFLCVW